MEDKLHAVRRQALKVAGAAQSKTETVKQLTKLIDLAIDAGVIFVWDEQQESFTEASGAVVNGGVVQINVLHSMEGPA